MQGYVESGEQLVVELYVHHLERRMSSTKRWGSKSSETMATSWSCSGRTPCYFSKRSLMHHCHHSIR